MSSLQEDMAALEAKIAKYERLFDAATAPEERRSLLDLITEKQRTLTAKQNTLTELLRLSGQPAPAPDWVLDASMGDLKIASRRVLETPQQQRTSSAFLLQPPLGFGYLPTYIRYDPFYFLGNSSLHSLLVPSSDDIEKAPVIPLEGERECFKPWSESEAGGISSQFDKIAALYGFEGNGQKQLKSRGLIHGIAQSTSYEDFHLKYEERYLAVMEVKGAEGSILGAILEASATATNFAVTLLRSGYAWSDIAVPVVANTGLCMVFGAIVLLNISFPAYIPISKRLDISDPLESKTASAYFFKLKAFSEKLATRTPGAIQNIASMKLDLEFYHVKSIHRSVYDGGLGHFDDRKGFPSIHLGCLHMVRVLNKLYDCPLTREIPEYPLSVRTPDNRERHYDVIYRNLSMSGFVIGCPNRLVEEQLFSAYVIKLKAIVRALYYDAGVVHGDLYASNIMWKRDGDEAVIIKIIDWDGAHLVEEGDFVPEVRNRLQDYFKGLWAVTFDHSHDLLFTEVFDEPVTEENKLYWENMASTSKKLMDYAFEYLLMNKLNPQDTI